MSGLGRLVPPDWDHVDKYPLRALAAQPTHVPVALGCNWYTNFDRPTKDAHGNYWIGQGSLGTVRGGHCVCVEPAPDPAVQGREQDATSWWAFYDQGAEGSCEGHGHARLMSLLNRKRYDAVWLYDQARKIDGDPDPNHEGTTNRAACEVMRSQGMRLAFGGVTTHLMSSGPPRAADGIAAYRWATTVDEVAATLGLPASQQYVTILNSWGHDYPERVRMPLATLARLISEDGEVSVVTDR